MVNLLYHELLKEKYLHADETRVQVMIESDRENTTDSYLWVCGSYAGSKNPIVYSIINQREVAGILKIFKRV